MMHPRHHEPAGRSHPARANLFPKRESLRAWGAAFRPVTMSLNIDPKTAEYGAVPKSKAPVSSPTEHMNHSVPTAPTRFSGAHKSAAEEHVAGHYSAHGAWLCHTGRVRRVNEDSVLAGEKIFAGSSE